jgi:hypothetical protein
MRPRGRPSDGPRGLLLHLDGTTETRRDPQAHLAMDKGAVLMKSIGKIALAVAAVILFGYLLDHYYCGPNAKYLALKAEYDEARKVAAADHEIQQGIIAEAEKNIAALNESIVTANATITAKDGQITALRTALAGLQEAEPPTTPEIEAMPIVINLRAQVSHLTEMFNLSQGIVAEQVKVIGAWEKKYDAQVTISDAWKREYENERRLRLMADELNRSLEHQAKSGQLFAKLSTAGLAAAGVFIIVRSITK